MPPKGGNQVHAEEEEDVEEEEEEGEDMFSREVVEVIRIPPTKVANPQVEIPPDQMYPEVTSLVEETHLVAEEEVDLAELYRLHPPLGLSVRTQKGSK